MSVLASVKFVFATPDWKSHVLFGLLLNLIPIAGPIAFRGWLAEMHQRLVRRHPVPLPKFDFGDFSHYLGRGLPVFLVSLVAALPMAVGFAVLGVIAAMTGVLAGVATRDAPLLMAGVWGVFGLFGVLCWLLFSVFLNAAQTRAELTEDFSVTLEWARLWRFVRATWSTVLIKDLSFAALAFGIIIAGALLCYVGLYPAIAVIQIAAVHLRYQVYMQYVARGGEPIPLKPPQWLPSEVQRYHRGY